MHQTMKMTAVMAMLALGMSLAACNDDVETDPEFNDLDCGPGESAQVDDVLVCIIENELLIETGFECMELIQQPFNSCTARKIHFVPILARVLTL